MFACFVCVLICLCAQASCEIQNQRPREIIVELTTYIDNSRYGKRFTMTPNKSLQKTQVLSATWYPKIKNKQNTQISTLNTIHIKANIDLTPFK